MKIAINEPQKVASYPYGSMRTVAHFSVEFAKNKGYRHVFQTVNPKTGRLNNPKKSTYSDLSYMEIGEDGFIQTRSLRLDSGDENQFDKFVSFVSENFELFTEAQVKDMALKLMATIKITVMSSIRYNGAKLEDIKDYFSTPLKKLFDIANTGSNLFSEISIDWEGVKSKEQKDFNPFKSTGQTRIV